MVGADRWVKEGGHVTLLLPLPLPGIGFEGKSDLIVEMRALAS
ncbi:hypothetical protein [Paracidovorax wautersii]|uniref:Uncharacterized protein n=1 Tax=Paracidovorax wautersii TaxID=1177982 RepID=A0ABU1IFU8_9BURK|nr:hypothetical protein [Paracidovorax wautersii]MDR6216097.1 hypothetical protein [Paracidovorax wautersii]